MCESDSPTITFGESTAMTVLNEFGWYVDSKGWIVDANGDRVESYSGDELKIEEFGGVVPKGEYGEPVPIRDNFVDIVEHVKDRMDKN